MPSAPRKKIQDTCDDWENQDYDDPITDSASSSQFKTEEIPSKSNSVSIHNDQSTSPNFISKASTNPIEIENSTLWNNANRNVKFVVLPANASHSAVTANRPLVQETMFGNSKLTILKRPKPEPSNQRNNSSSSSSTSSGIVSINMREKSYLEARERIFGVSSSSSLDDDKHSSKSKSPQISPEPSQTNLVAIERQPMGPPGLNQKGFSNGERTVPAHS